MMSCHFTNLVEVSRRLEIFSYNGNLEINNALFGQTYRPSTYLFILFTGLCSSVDDAVVDIDDSAVYLLTLPRSDISIELRAFFRFYCN